jgi:hypothetical protein
MQDSELDEMLGLICASIELLHERSKIGGGGYERLIFNSLAVFLEDQGILDEMQIVVADEIAIAERH